MFFQRSRISSMENTNKNERNEDFLEILKSEENINFKIDKKTLFISTDRWLAQLGKRKKN